MTNEELIEKLEGAYSTFFDRSLARQAANRIRELTKQIEVLERQAEMAYERIMGDDL